MLEGLPTPAQDLLAAARILVVDDSRMLRMGISRSLRKIGVQQIEEAADGMAALERLEREPFDAMLLDMEMPLMDGLAVLAKMQTSANLRGLPVIVISGAESIDGVVACIEMGAEDYLPKPFSEVLLRARLTSSLEKKQLRDLERAQRLQLQSQHDLLKLEQEKTENLLLNILPRSIANRLKAGEERCADSHANVTVMFCDLVGFTKMSQGMDPRELVEMLHELFSNFDRLVDEAGLEKIKTIGDCYMLVGGLPDPRQDHAQAVTDVALKMISTLARLDAAYNSNLQIRIGIHSGPVVAGVIGTHKFTYDIWGTTVNEASRMESSGQPSRIHISEVTAGLLTADFDLEHRGMVETKSLGLLSTYFVNGRRPC